MKLAEKIIEAKKIIILPKDNTSSINSAKKFAKALGDLSKALESFESSNDAQLMSVLDNSDYRMFHDSKRLVKILASMGISMVDAAKDGKVLPKLDKITRDKGNK